MIIYLVLEEYWNRTYNTLESYSVYTYQSYGDAIQRMMYESSTSKSEIERQLQENGKFDSGTFYYKIEESELQ